MQQKRAARIEARQIRMRELERQQQEVTSHFVVDLIKSLLEPMVKIRNETNRTTNNNGFSLFQVGTIGGRLVYNYMTLGVPKHLLDVVLTGVFALPQLYQPM